MGTVVLCAVLWAGAAMAGVHCAKRWRSGPDQVWLSKWKALAVALVVTAYSVMATGRLVPPAAGVFLEVLAGLLFLGSAGSAGAGWVAARRSAAQTRVVRGGLGLPVERELWSPWVVGVLWSAAGFAVTAVEVVVIAWYVEAHSGPTADGTWNEAKMLAWLSVLTLTVFVVVGCLHGFVQHRRRVREQQRVRHAEQHYLLQAAD
ncbi:hypothetical protein [Streptomyces lavendofoliae]|uniref:hypothetical protein n=1 Tax=Streptomyces lavendofoliae TaxID=67314 RepID=UPI003D8E8489